MLTAVLAIFATAFLAPTLTSRLKRSAGWVLALLPGGLTAWFLSHLATVDGGGALVQVLPWLPQLGVELAFRLDGLSLAFALMITGIGTAIVIYAGGYLHGDRQLPRFYLLLLAFMGAMLGVVLADDLVTLFVFWELTSFTSYFLIGYSHEAEESRDSALQAVMITGSGGLAMLAGFLILGHGAGTFRISELLADPAALQALPGFLPAMLLVILGALTKSAQFPFHVWLPNAMAAPTPVSAYLHSATMVKAGVYLLARTQPGFGEHPWFAPILISAGVATVLTAAALSLLQRDIKRLLAYSTLYALGILTLLIGVGTPLAAEAMVVYMLAHALYKAPLFMVAGSVDHEAGSRDVTVLRGLGRAMPVTWAVALAAGVSAAGLIPMLGFVGKELAYEALLSHPLPLAGLVAASAVMFALTVMVVLKPFVGRKTQAPKAPHEAPLSMWLGPAVLAVLGLTFGLLPDTLGQGLAVPAASTVFGAPLDFYLALWHGLTPALWLTLATVALGIGTSFAWRSLHQWLSEGTKEVRFGPAGAYAAWLTGIKGVAAWQTRILQSDDLRNHLLIILGFAVGISGFALLVTGGVPLAWTMERGQPHEVAFLVLVAVAALGVVRARSRLVAITSLGVVGFGIALIFISFSAPDLAITQFLVETLIVIIVALVLVRLPRSLLRDESGGRHRAMSAFVAVAAGLLITTLLWSVTSTPLDRTIPAFFEATSYPEAFGKNIVNVILVDFRALDTLGEIVVLAVAASGVYALLRHLRSNRQLEEDPDGPRGLAPEATDGSGS